MLVDRLGPRGVTKEAAQLDGWLKAIAHLRELLSWHPRVTLVYAAPNERVNHAAVLAGYLGQ